jgi:hypothetical protein
MERFDVVPVEVNKQDISIAVGAFAIAAMRHVHILCKSMMFPLSNTNYH